MNIVIFTDEIAQKGGWHGAQLQAVFTARNVNITFASLKDCLLDLSGKKPAIESPQLKQLPEAAFVRSISGGTLQQITQRLNILHALKMLGVIVYNDGHAIERTVDKAMTSFLLQNNAVKTPKTWVCESRGQAHEIMANNPQLIIKPIFGSQGQGVRMVSKQLPLPMDAHVDGVFYLQQFIKASSDYRVFIVNNKPVAAMKRTGETWLHNAALGAKCTACNEQNVINLACQAALVLDINYCGVDVIKDKNGQLFVLEINSIPAWRSLQSVTDVNIAEALVDDLISKL